MAVPTLIATAGATNANSYCTVAEGDAYHEAHLYASSWEAAETDQKTIALIWATRLLDETYEWKGEVTSIDQALRWPRSWVLDRDGHKYLDHLTIPTFLKQATAELARLLIIKDRLQALDDAASGISAVSAGSVSVTFTKTDRQEAIPDSVYQIVAPYVEIKLSGSHIAKLVRV